MDNLGASSNTLHIRPTITFDQYKAAHAHVMAAKPKVMPRRTWKYYVTLAIVCLAFGLASHYPPARIPELTLGIALILVSVCCKPWVKRSQEKCLRRFYEEEQGKLNDQLLTLDESGIACNQGDGKAVSHHTWASFIYQIDMADAFLFLPTPNTFIRVPKVTLSASEQGLIREWSSTVSQRLADHERTLHK